MGVNEVLLLCFTLLYITHRAELSLNTEVLSAHDKPGFIFRHRIQLFKLSTRFTELYFNTQGRYLLYPCKTLKTQRTGINLSTHNSQQFYFNTEESNSFIHKQFT